MAARPAPGGGPGWQQGAHAPILDDPDAARIDADRGQSASISGARVDIDAVAIVSGALDRRMSMHDQHPVIARVIGERLADPGEVILDLGAQIDPGADAGVDEKGKRRQVPGGQAVKPARMIGRDCGQRAGPRSLATSPNGVTPCRVSN